jgi:hypothetical protein
MHSWVAGAQRTQSLIGAGDTLRLHTQNNIAFLDSAARRGTGRINPGDQHAAMRSGDQIKAEASKFEVVQNRRHALWPGQDRDMDNRTLPIAEFLQRGVDPDCRLRDLTNQPRGSETICPLNDSTSGRRETGCRSR